MDSTSNSNECKGQEEGPLSVTEKQSTQQTQSITEMSSLMEDVIEMPSSCPCCNESATTKICEVQVPHFKQIILMSLLCDSCGYRTTEVKPAGSISDHGTRMTLLIQNDDDLKREIVLSDTAGIQIIDIELELPAGTGEGVYTTVEGLIKRILKQLSSSNPFANGCDAETVSPEDGSETVDSKYRTFLTKLRDIGEGNIYPTTLVISDPLSNSFIGPAPGEAIASDTQEFLDQGSIVQRHGLTIEVYERTDAQNDALGLQDVKTEGY